MQSMFDRELALEILNQIFDAIQKIKKRFAPIDSAEEFIKTDEGMEKLDSICMQLIAIGESLKNYQSLVGIMPILPVIHIDLVQTQAKMSPSGSWIVLTTA